MKKINKNTIKKMHWTEEVLIAIGDVILLDKLHQQAKNADLDKKVLEILATRHTPTADTLTDSLSILEASQDLD